MASAEPYNFLEAFFNELLGRYASLQQFVEGTRLQSGSKSPRLFDIYSSQIWERVIDIAYFANRVANASPSSLTEKKVSHAFHYLASQSDQFQKLHRTLRWFSAPWPEAEMFQFLGRLFEEQGQPQLLEDVNKLDPSIVFTDEYNFFTYDVGYVRKDIPRSTLKAWALPKSESGNPLLWPVLAHEVAHSLFRNTEGEDEVLEYVSQAVGLSDCKEPVDLIQRWAVELNADLFAFRLFGPAYLYSLMYFSMFFISGDLHQPLVTDREDSRSLHPPPRVRVELLMKESRSMKVLGGKESRDFERTLSAFENLFNARLLCNQLDYQSEPADYNELLLSDATIAKLWRALVEMQEKYFPRGPERNKLDILSISSLSLRLQQGLLAGSFPVIDEKLVGDYLGNKGGTTRHQALISLNEKPARMIDIVNAGWMCYVPSGSKRVTCTLFDKLRPMEGVTRENVLPIMESLTESSRQLQTSIQVALIIAPLI